MTPEGQTVKEQRAQAQRVETVLSRLMDPSQYLSTYCYTPEGISFRVDSATTGQILCEAYSPTSAVEIQSMSDELIETRLRVLFNATRENFRLWR